MGPSFSSGEVRKFLTNGKYFKKYKITKEKSIEKKIARLLSKGEMVANMSGRMEWGARALGNRSIMANASNFDTIQVINEAVKGRDFWMPFTPSILKERENDYIVNPKKIPAPYMILTFDTKPLAKEHIRASLHPYDFTARPQLVEKDWNPRYYKILKEYEKITGMGGFLNTSFNLHGLPIVYGPKEAVYAFENCGLKYLALEDYLIEKK